MTSGAARDAAVAPGPAAGAPVPAAPPALDDIPLTIIGHPYAPIGMGEQLRSHVQACTALRLHHRVFDIFRYAQRTDAVHFQVIGERERRDLPGGIRMFHINGDEVERVIEAFEARGGDFAAGYNIVVPAWELPAYPAAWAGQSAPLRRSLGAVALHPGEPGDRRGRQPPDRPGGGAGGRGDRCRGAISAFANRRSCC